MSKGKTWQRVASAFLAAVMTFSTFSTTIAYAAEATTDSSITTDAVSDTDAAEEVDATDSAASSSTTEGEVTKPEATEAPAATETPDETDATEPEETPVPTEAPTPTPEPTESPEATAEPEPTEEPEETETPDVSESDFVAVGLADDATEGQIDAEIGDEVTFNAHVNRDDVNLQYQWYKRFIEPQTTEYDEDLMEYDYGGDEPTAYGFLVEGKTPAEVLAENPDAGWSGIELYRAVVSAMEAIGADTSNVNIEFGTRNYALEGFTITATMVDGNVVISADKDNEHATGTLNENNEFAFAESTNNDIAVQPAEVQTEEEVDPDSLEANGWEAIEGATSDTYTHTVDEYDAYTTYRCVITIVDDNYIAAAKQALVALGADESKLTDDALDNTFMSEITIHIPSMDASEDDIYNDLSVEDKLKQRLALSGIATYAAGVQLDSQSNPQWVTGLSAGMEYLTADMYAKLYGQDGKGGWLAEGKVTPEQADRYWSKITSAGAKSWAVANELNNDGLPTGATRKYQSFTLTDGKLEINSEWYGKTVYFRYYNPNVVGNTATGTAVSVPAAGRGTSYKDAVQVLFCYVIEESGITLPLTIKEYVTQATHNGYSANNMAHITLNTVSANDFNVDPDRYLKDAEGNYRNDSVYWGTCYYSEPDLSGKAYYALKNYIGNGYGFGIGHDTMYAYAGAYFDAYGGGSGYPNVKYTEKNIDPNDTATRYYSVNSYKVNTGHWNMNALMGENNSNTLVGSGYYSASDEEYFGWIVDPLTVPSAIMSSGGSHGPFAKSTIYGSKSLYIRTNGGYTYEQAMANPDIKHRTPTNWPYKFNQGDTIPAALTHSNGQVAFDDIWVQYNGCSNDFTSRGLGKLYEPTVDGRQGTNNFYLAGSGNFVMNQIGHLPLDDGGGHVNRASPQEMQLCVNTLMWISQRKQCEVCAADQGDQQMTHFVHRVNTANAKKILTALANGGSYWYSLNDCYELMEDLNLQKLGFNSANWKPIKNFTGHWNSKYFDVKVPRDAALFDNKTGTLGAYRTGDGNDWNLGTNKKNGWDTVFKDSGSSAPSVRTTGIARIYGKLGDAKLFNDGQIHEGYTVHIRYEDNLELLQEGDDFSCVVNNVDQYCISNLPCIYQGGSTIMRARVYDKNGNEVTKYGPIVAKVPPHFWNDCETVPLELLKVEATPIENYQYWEGETSKVLKGSGIIYNQPISDSAVTWYYRIVDLRNTSDVVADWTKITNKTFTTSDGSVSGVIGTPIFHDGNDGINNYPHSSVDVQLSMLAYTGHAIQLRTDYLIEGKVYSTIDPGVITPEASGIIQIEERPMSMTQSPNQRVMTQDQAIFTFESDYWKGLGDKGYNVKVQYIGPYDDDWQDVETSTTFGGTYTLNTVDGSQHAKIKVESSTVDTLKEGAKTESKIHDNKWLPGTFWRPDGFTDQQCAQKHTTVKLTLYAADYNWAGYKFRIVASYRFNDKRTKVETSDSANGDEDNAKYDQSRYGLLTVDAPYISATTMKAQALMMQKHNDENDASGDFGQNYWSEKDTPEKVAEWNSTRGDSNNPIISDENIAVYTTNITFSPGKLTESGDRLLTPILQWGFQDDLTSTSTEYTPVINPIDINGYANTYSNGVGLTTSNYKDFKAIGERLVEVTVTEPKDIVYGDTTNPDFTVNAVATNGDGTHGAAVKPDSLGLKMALVYTPFENDKTTDNAQTAPLTADAKATLTPDIASGDDGVESDSQFKTENVKNAGTYTYTVSSDYDAAVEQNYAVTIKVIDADKNEADGQLVIARKDLTVTLDPNPSTKLYGTKTVIPEVKTSGYAFDESVETVKLPAFELIVASSVDGIFGNVGLTKDAFKYVGGSYDNYNYLPATGDLEVKRLKLDDVKEPITITGTVFDEKTGKNVEVTKNFGDDLSKLYFNSAVEVSAPEGYAIGTSDSLTDADWAEKMVISDNGTKVTSDFYLIDLTTGAITSVGTVTSSIDTVVPVTVSAFTANAVDAATKTDLMNEKFTKFETAINIFITGEEIGKAPVKEDDKKTDDTEKKDDADKKDETEKKDETTDESKKDETVDKSEAETQRVAHGKPTKDKTEKQSVVEVKASVPAISKLDGEYNSGVAKIQYYKVNGTNIVKDTEGNYTFDESKFETVDVKNISKDNGYVSFNLSPDWTGYIVTRTVDKAGNYGDVRVMSVKLENPPAPETPRATATPAPAEEKPAPKLIVAAQAPTGVGLSANIVIPVIVVVALIAVGAVVIVKKKGGKKEEAAEKTEDKPEEKSEDESKEDKQ